jgi:hypothetical protein
VTGSFYGRGYFALEFQGCSGNPAGKDLSLFIQEFLEKFRIFVIYILDLVL